jgi:Spy/CpxP family protein refolding chaperone
MLYIVDVEKNEIVERDFTDEELAIFEVDATNRTKQNEAMSKAEADKAAAKAKLSALGLTADDLKALGL